MWSLSTQGVVPGKDVVDVINALEFEGEAAPHVIEQIDATKSAATALLLSGAYGSLEDSGVGFHVTISGHANAEHKPVVGYDGDMGSVHVGQHTIAQTAENATEPASAEQAVPVGKAPPAETPPAQDDPPVEPAGESAKTPPVPGSEGGAS